MKSLGIRFWKLLVDIYWRIRSSELLPGKSISLSRAEKLAHLLLEKGALKVQLFGSTARRGDGHDIDIIAIVPDDMAKKFLDNLEMMIWQRAGETKNIYPLVRERLGLAEKLLNISHSKEMYPIVLGTRFMGADDFWYKHRQGRYRQIDIHLFPDKWETNEYFQDRVPLSDPLFFLKIAKDLRKFDPISGEFNGFNFWQVNFSKLTWRWWKLYVNMRLKIHSWRRRREQYAFLKYRRRTTTF